jgi:hypothetical protein
MIRSVFIVGAGRSGTKFMMNVLNNSDSVHLAPEIHYFSWLFHAGFRKNLRKAYKRVNGEYDLNDVVSCILNGEHFGTYWRRDNGFSEAEIRKWFEGRKVSEENIYKFLIDHDAARNRAADQLLLRGEKGGSNVFHLKELFEWFPEARVIFMYRAPLDVLKSEVNKGSKPDYPLSKRNPLYAYGLVPMVFLIWALGALNALRYARRHPQIYFVSYEQMASALDEVARTLASACGIAYSEELCKVSRVDSSFGSSEGKAYWNPPAWVRGLYRLFLDPLRKQLDRKSVHRGLSAPSA